MSRRIGLVGCGRWGRLILRDLRALGADVSVCAPTAATRAAALDLGAVSAHAAIADLPAADGYVVAPPTVAHAEAIEALLPRGRPIFVEKPLTHDLAAAERIAAAAPDLVFVMDKWRYHPGVEALAALVRSGALGKVRALRSLRLGWGNPHADVDSIWILAPHDLSMAIEILGHLPPALHAFCVAPGPAGAESFVGLLGAPGGPQVLVETSSEHPVSRRSLTVIGTAGSAQLGDSYDDRVLVRRAGAAGPAEEVAVSAEMPLLRELRAFLDHLAGGPPPRSSAADALSVVRRLTELRVMAGLPPA